jgi:uncharacterized protein
MTKLSFYQFAQIRWDRYRNVPQPTLTERLQLFAMRTSKGTYKLGLVGMALATALALSGTAYAAGKAKFASPEAAVNHGLGALQSGETHLAIQAFEDAATVDAENVPALYYLARIYSDNSQSFTDHGKAYSLYMRIANAHTNIDPDDDDRAPFVAKAMTQLALYMRNGLPNHGVMANSARAAELLRHAATFFNDEDAQFEYAKLQLRGDGIPEDRTQGLYWLSQLGEKGHTGAQAFLADLYWRGLHVPKDPTRALLLITLATENAPASDRVWLEDAYQNMFCGAGLGVRKQASGAVADWRQKYSRPVQIERQDRSGLTAIQPHAMRTCSNGEAVGTPKRSGTTAAPMTNATASLPQTETQASPAQLTQTQAPQTPASPSQGRGQAMQSPMMQGNALGFGLRDAGSSSLAPRR